MLKKLQILVLSTILLICTNTSASEDQGLLDQNFLFFPFAHVEYRPDVHADQNLEALEFEAGSDFIYLLNYRKIRVLAEIFATNEEIELERLQFGLNLSQNKTFWIGRFHTPLGYWNSNYHHGLYLQTSVHRPGIIEYEDDGGALPNHITGGLLDGQYYTENGVVNYSLAAGLAPTIGHHGLEPYSFGSISENKLHGLLKVSYQFDETNPTESGFVVGLSQINVEHNVIEDSLQSIFGVFSHQSQDTYRITTAAYIVRNRLNYESSKRLTNSFVAAYVHGEYDLASKWIVYARAERMFGYKNDPYLALFEHNESQRNLAGVRFDITRRQAISSEVSQRIGGHDNHTHVSFQWSAVFP